jgi:peptide methionine sulfoxide reductase MsrB
LAVLRGSRAVGPGITVPQEVILSDSEDKVVRSDAEWRTLLTPQQYHVLREKGTERPFTGLLTENHETGNYHCAACGALLFMSGAKFDSGCGWPSFMIPSRLQRRSKSMRTRATACGAWR